MKHRGIGARAQLGKSRKVGYESVGTGTNDQTLCQEVLHTHWDRTGSAGIDFGTCWELG